MQWHVVQTLFQEMKSRHNQKDGSIGTPKLGPCWKLEHVICLEKGVENRIKSRSRDNIDSWVRISHRLNKFVMNLNNNETEFLKISFEEHVFVIFSALFLQISSVFTEQSQTFVKNVNLLHDRSGQFDMVMGQSIVLWNQDRSSFGEFNDPVNQNFYWNNLKNDLKVFHRLTEWVNFAWMKDWEVFCWDLTVFHYYRQWRTIFMQRLVVNTFFQEGTDHHNLKDGSREKQKSESVLEVTTSCLYRKHGVEIRILFLSEDSTQSWVRLSHGSNKFLIASNNNYRSSWRSAWRTSVTTEGEGFCMPIKGDSKTAMKRVCCLFTEYHSDESKVLDWYLTRELLFLSAYENSKKVIHLLRLSQKVQREDDGAIQLWRIQENYQVSLHKFFFGRTIDGKHAWRGGGAKRRYQYCLDDSGIIIYFRVHLGHSGCNLTDLSLQDNVVILSGLFQHF